MEMSKHIVGMPWPLKARHHFHPKLKLLAGRKRRETKSKEKEERAEAL